MELKRLAGIAHAEEFTQNDSYIHDHLDLRQVIRYAMALEEYRLLTGPHYPEAAISSCNLNTLQTPIPGELPCLKTMNTESCL